MAIRMPLTTFQPFLPPSFFLPSPPLFSAYSTPSPARVFVSCSPCLIWLSCTSKPLVTRSSFLFLPSSPITKLSRKGTKNAPYLQAILNFCTFSSHHAPTPPPQRNMQFCILNSSFLILNSQFFILNFPALPFPRNMQFFILNFSFLIANMVFIEG